MFPGLIAHPERVPDAGAEVKREVDAYSAKFLARVPWLKKRLAESGRQGPV